MKYKIRAVLAVAAPLALPGVVSAAGLGWFDDMPARDSLGQIRAPFPSDQDSLLTFGVDAYNALIQPRSADDDYGYRDGASSNDRTRISFYGEVARHASDFRAPLAALNPRSTDASWLEPPSSRLSGFGVKWQHRVDSANTVAFSAGYSEMPWSTAGPAIEGLDTRAAVSWQGIWSETFLQPGISGSVFVGDESARDEAYQQLGRRYFGISLGGQLRLAQDHTPYFSYRVRRSFYNPDDPAYVIAPYEDRSQISAGWKWQVQPNWSLQAEARYGLNGANLDPYSPDRSRFFFVTRFDFR